MTTDTFEALDVSAHMPPEDIPEVVEVKKRITEVAKKYTDRHGWCDEVARALEEAGVISEKIIRVDVNLGPLGTTTLKVNPSDLHDKTAKQQAKVVAKEIGGATVRVGSTRVDYSTKDVEGFITKITLHEEDPNTVSTEPNSAWMVLSTGSAAHLFRGYLSASSSDRYLATACDNYGDYISMMKVPTASTKKCSKCQRRESA